MAASHHAGFKKKIHKLMGSESISAVSTESCRGEMFFLFSMEITWKQS